MFANSWSKLFLWALLSLPALAQGYNFNFGAGPGFPLGQTNKFANTSYNLVVGGGPNLGDYVKLNSEFMFQGLPVNQDLIKETGLSQVKGRLYALTGNVIIGTSKGNKSVYVIGGGGWYRRTLEAKKTILQAGSSCSPEWLWWNIECVNGIFPTDITVGSRTVSAGGFNVGAGVAFRMGESGAPSFYAEIRYHHAFTQNVETVVLPLTFGIRW